MKESLQQNMWVYARVAVVVALVVVAAWAGLWLGGLSVRVDRPLGSEADEDPSRPAEPASGKTARTGEPAPLFLFVNAPLEGDWTAAWEETRMAAAAGVHQYMLPLALPWEGLPPETLAPLRKLIELDPAAQVVVYVRADPPEAWRTSHPDEVARIGETVLPYASVGSDMWLDDVRSALGTLIQGLRDTGLAGHVVGYEAAALEAGRWYYPEGYESSAASAAAFRRWLALRYEDDAALAAAWADETATLATASIPERPNTNDATTVFFDLPKMQRQVDFLRYTSERTADTIAAIAVHIRATAGPEIHALAPYGYTFELERNVAGHFALMDIIDSDIDGFVSPVSYIDRGLGGAGGPMGPVDSARLHGKQWYLVDDTRTGITRDPASGAISRHKGLRIEDVFNVQQRNFAAALTHGLGLFWTDPAGEGALCEESMWEQFAAMRSVYEQQESQAPVPVVEDALDEAWPPANATLAVVVDEESRFYQQCDAPLNALVLSGARDAALRAGVPTRFYLLADVLEERAPQAPVYLFVNVFKLDDSQREQLHAVLARQKATAIWLYAPGYVADKPGLDSLAKTVRMKVKAFDGPAKSGSVYQLAGAWITKGEEFGGALTWQPLFYVDDPDADVIAKFRDSDKASVAMAFFDEGWASVFVAEPSLTPGVLREILRILEQHIYFQEGPARYFDVAYFGPRLLGVHAAEAGDREIDLGSARYWDVQDLLAPEIGWPQKQTFRLPLNAGETRLLSFAPVEGLPEEDMPTFEPPPEPAPAYEAAPEAAPEPKS